jgi:hypothetical protein
MSPLDARQEKELEADVVRERVVRDVERLARSGDALLERSRAVMHQLRPVLIGIAVVGVALVARRSLRRVADVPERRSFAVELARRATLSFVSVAVARWARTTPLLGPPAPAVGPGAPADGSGERRS